VGAGLEVCWPVGSRAVAAPVAAACNTPLAVPFVLAPPTWRHFLAGSFFLGELDVLASAQLQSRAVHGASVLFLAACSACVTGSFDFAGGFGSCFRKGEAGAGVSFLLQL
jgi:hypothetical protein